MILKTFLTKRFDIRSAEELSKKLDMNVAYVRGYWTGRQRITPLFAAKLQKVLPYYVTLDELMGLKK